VSVVFDSSAVLAAFQGEPGGEVVTPLLDGGCISVVNLAEVTATLARRNPPDAVRDIVREMALRVVDADAELAIDAGLLRSITDQAGLSLGDRFCLALARRLGAPVITADRAWLQVASAAGLKIRLIR
jgi:PIN domain nuclease of toxin-antitoxin system